MQYQIRLTDDARHDLVSTYSYIADKDSIASADYVISNIESTFESLQQMPERGSYVKELMSLGLKEFREVFFKPYRIIYRVQARTIDVYVIADGRRDIQALLQFRLLT